MSDLQYHFVLECGSCDFKTKTPWDKALAHKEMWKHAIAKHMDCLEREYPPTGLNASRKDGPICPWCWGSGVHRAVGLTCQNSSFHGRKS